MRRNSEAELLHCGHLVRPHLSALAAEFGVTL